MDDFVIRRWELSHTPGDQAPPHIHHASTEAFCVLRGRLEVLVGHERRIIGAGEYVVIPAGMRHTFATVEPDGVDLLAVMSPEIDELVAALHRSDSADDRVAVWKRYRSSIAPQTDLAAS